ncbi:MAG: EamA family transporter [Candidatus Komeilibacteria bacterium]|nr:EamA family transporter [Candidatus Komeilibacteria bacterium]
MQYINWKKIGPYLIMLAAILWALDGILRRSLFSLPPITIVFYEHLIGLLILSPFLFKNIKKLSFSKKEWGALLLISLLSGVLGTLWFTTALIKVNFISFSVVFLLQKLQPVFAMLFAVIFLKEKISKKYLIWAILALVSAYFVTFKDGLVGFNTGDQTMIAALFALGAAFAWGSSTAFSRFALLRKSNTVVTGMRFLITSILALGFVFILGQQSSLGTPTSSQWGRFVIIAFSTGMVALWIYYRGLKNTQVKVATILELTFPFLAVIIDIFLYKNFLAPSQYIAAVVLLFAMYKVSRLNTAFDKIYSTNVIGGAGRGKRLGFPTLNFIIPSNFEHSYGVYCGSVIVNGNKHKAVFHYGSIPTFADKRKSLEAYLISGEHLEEIPDELSFRFVAKLRDVEKFSAKDKLVANIENDIKQAKEILNK